MGIDQRWTKTTFLPKTDSFAAFAVVPVETPVGNETKASELGGQLMHWKTKAAIMRLCAALPYGDRIYKVGQKRFGRLTVNEDLRRKMGQAGLQRVMDHYTWEDSLSVMEEVYKQVT